MVDGYQPPTSPITPVQKVGVWYLGLSENPEKKKRDPTKEKKQHEQWQVSKRQFRLC